MKSKKILLIIIVVLILVIGTLLLRPVFSNNNMEIIDNSVNEIDISLGVNPTASDSSVKINNNNIYINKGGIYNISGIHINGTIYIDTTNEVTLNFLGVTIVNELNSVIDNRNSSKIIINLANNTNNILSDGGASSGVIKSVGDIFIEGRGKLLIYANMNNGIESKENLVIDGPSIYISAIKDAFVVNKEFLINSGNIIGIGNNTMKLPNELSKQNVMLFNFPDKYLENTTFSLVDNSNEPIYNFVALRDFNTLIISTPNIKNGSHHILRDITCDGKPENGVYSNCTVSGGERVSIGISDTFTVDSKSNWFGEFLGNITNPDNFV